MSQIRKIHLALMKYWDMMELADIMKIKLQVRYYYHTFTIGQLREELEFLDQLKYPDTWRDSNGYTSMDTKMVSK